MDGNAKSDLERTGERTVAVSTKGGTVLTKFFARLVLWSKKYYQKHFSSSMKALKKDGPTKELTISTPITKEETKEMIAKAREANILIGIKKMQPDGEVGTNQSLHQQEKMAKNEILYNKWNDRRKTFNKIPILKNICSKKADTYKKLALEDNSKNKDERYIVICNKSHRAFLIEELEKLTKKRLDRSMPNELDGINSNDTISKEEYSPIFSRDVNILPEELNKVGEDYGSCLVKDYQKNYCLQRISKLEYCEIREQLFELKSHGACVLNDNEVLIAINSDDLEEYKRIAPLDKPIKEFGEGGARDIEAESNMNNIMSLEVSNDKEFASFKEKYKGKDFIAQHNPDGTTNIFVKEEDTKNLVDDVKKKSSTADLLKEANEFALENNTNEINIGVDLEEEQEIAR